MQRRTAVLIFPAAAAGVLASPVWAGTPEFASRVVYGVHNGEAVYEQGVGTPLTFGPFTVNPLWNDPASLVGKPNTLDYDDLTGAGPVPGGFAGGPMRRINLVWPSWQYGSNDPSDLGTRPGWLDGRRRNGLGLSGGGQAVVEFDEPVVNNPDDGGARHWGVDLIVHGNSYFGAATGIAAESSMNAVALTGTVFAEPITVHVAQSVVGPWYRLERPADALFPTHPWAWDRDAGAWTGEEQDWAAPVNPSLTASDFAGLTAADAIDLYDGSAGGTPYDLDALLDGEGSPASLPWIRFVRFTDPDGNAGEICGVVDVAGEAGCNQADVADPFGVLDLSDIGAFVSAFTSAGPLADLAEPLGVFDLADIAAFVAGFTEGCP